MNKNLFLILLAAVTVLGACSNKVTKNLYGSWEPILAIYDTANVWQPVDENFFISVSGKCEEVVVTRTERGDIANPEVEMPNAKCGGDRDELSFTDTINTRTDYVLKLDASKDTLTGTATQDYHNEYAPVVTKIKFLRIQ